MCRKTSKLQSPTPALVLCWARRSCQTRALPRRLATSAPSAQSRMEIGTWIPPARLDARGKTPWDGMGDCQHASFCVNSNLQRAAVDLPNVAPELLQFVVEFLALHGFFHVLGGNVLQRRLSVGRELGCQGRRLLEHGRQGLKQTRQITVQSTSYPPFFGQPYRDVAGEVCVRSALLLLKTLHALVQASDKLEHKSVCSTVG